MAKPVKKHTVSRPISRGRGLGRRSEKDKHLAAAQTFRIERYLIFAPLFGAMLAISFDVGYFWGTDINFFTLFSASEHFVFAMEISPYAVLLAFVGTITFSVISRWRQVRTRYRLKNIILRYGAKTFKYLAIGWLIFAAYQGGGIGGVLFGLAILLFFIGSDLVPSSDRRPYFLVGVIVMSVIFCNALGYETARGYLMAGALHQIELKNGQIISGKIIRTGEKGVMFHDVPSKRIVFRQWNDIGTLEKSMLGSIVLLVATST